MKQLSKDFNNITKSSTIYVKNLLHGSLEKLATWQKGAKVANDELFMNVNR